jgi:hypothetical protein
MLDEFEELRFGRRGSNIQLVARRDFAPTFSMPVDLIRSILISMEHLCSIGKCCTFGLQLVRLRISRDVLHFNQSDSKVAVHLHALGGARDLYGTCFFLTCTQGLINR